MPIVTDQALSPADFENQNVVLLGHLDNNRHVARLYHNFFVCLDQGYTGRTGYELRSVHDPFGTGHNAILVSGSFAEGTLAAAQAFAALVKAAGRPGSLALGRVLDLKLDPRDRATPLPTKVTPAAAAAAVAQYRKSLFSPGAGRNGVAGLVNYGLIDRLASLSAEPPSVGAACIVFRPSLDSVPAEPP